MLLFENLSEKSKTFTRYFQIDTQLARATYGKQANKKPNVRFGQQIERRKIKFDKDVLFSKTRYNKIPFMWKGSRCAPHFLRECFQKIKPVFVAE